MMIDAFEATYFGSVPGWAVIVFIWGAAGVLFGVQLRQATRLIMLGRPDDRFGDKGARFKEFLTGWLGQKKVLEDRFIGTLHAMIFWGFLCLATDMFDLATGGRFEPLLAGINQNLADVWNLLVDFGYALALLGTLGALYRRVIVRPEKLKHESQTEGILILCAIIGIGFTIQSLLNTSETVSEDTSTVASSSSSQGKVSSPIDNNSPIPLPATPDQTPKPRQISEVAGRKEPDSVLRPRIGFDPESRFDIPFEKPDSEPIASIETGLIPAAAKPEARLRP